MKYFLKFHQATKNMKTINDQSAKPHITIAVSKFLLLFYFFQKEQATQLVIRLEYSANKRNQGSFPELLLISFLKKT